MRLDEDDAPDWSYWRLVPTVKLFEAVSLSLNIDPKRLVPHPAGGGTAGIAIVRVPPPQFYGRLDLARRCIGETLPAAKPRYGEEHVTLQSFTKWATGLGWDVPPELEPLAGEIELSDSMAKSELQEPTHSGAPGRPPKGKHLIDRQFEGPDQQVSVPSYDQPTPEPVAAELISDAGRIARGSDADQRQTHPRPQQDAFRAWRERNYPNGITTDISVKSLAAEYNKDTGLTVSPSSIRRALGRKQ
jgi:hypothetical protein